MTVPRSREEFLRTTLVEVLGCWLGLRCAGCTKSGYLPLRLIANKHGSRCVIRAVIERLRCSRCQSGPASVWLVDYPVEGSEHGGQVASWHVDLFP